MPSNRLSNMNENILMNEAPIIAKVDGNVSIKSTAYGIYESYLMLL